MRIRRAVMVALVMVTGILLTHPWNWYGQSDALGAFFDLFVVAWFAMPFIPVAAAIADGSSSRYATSAAFAMAVAGTVMVPRWVNSSIENDPSSTAAVAHVIDPIPVVLVVGVVLGLDYLARRFEASRARHS